MIVVDTNVLAYLYLPSEHTRHAEELLQREPDWAAPILWRSEFRNILAGYMRRKILSFEVARELQLEAESLLSGTEHEVDSTRILELARDSGCTAYDCEFVAVAMRLGVKLVTMDSKLLKAFPGNLGRTASCRFEHRLHAPHERLVAQIDLLAQRFIP